MIDLYLSTLFTYLLTNPLYHILYTRSFPSLPHSSQPYFKEEQLKRPKNKDKATLKKLEEMEGANSHLVADNLLLSTAITAGKQELGTYAMM